MKRKSNWLKNLLQWGTLAAIVGFVVYGLTLGEKPADVEAYCPFGGLQALGSYLVNNSLACTMSMTQIMVGVMLAVGVILFSKLFCGYLCPLGTVSEWMGPGRQKTEGQRRNPPGKHRRPPAPRRQIRAAVLRVLHVGVEQRTFLQEFRPLLRRRHGLQG